MKFKCINCNSEITNISISKEYILRDDYELSDGVFTRIDREYFDGKVDAVIFNCPKCGEHVIKIPEIIDFVRDSDIINPKDIKSNIYGTLIKY
jgi:transcription elongation factor Elf1